MLVSPDTICRVANSEAVSLRLDADAQPAAARLDAVLGDWGADAELDGGELAFPSVPAPNVVRVRWLDADGGELHDTYVEVVSSHYFRLAALRSYGDGRDEFHRLSDEVLYQARQAATEVFEEAANRSFVHRLGRTKDYGRDGLLQLAHNDVYELVTPGYALASDSQCTRDSHAGPYPAWVSYKYGCQTVPAQVSRAVLELAAYMLRPTNRPIGATGESTDAGYIHFTTAGRDGATDIPEVNAAVEQFGRGPQLVW